MLSPRDYLLVRARESGFRVARLASVGPTPRFEAFRSWVAAGHHADMAWLGARLEERSDPRHKLLSAKTALVLAVEHHHTRPADPGGRTGLVARYAWGRDYHNLVGKRLKKLGKALRADGHGAWGGVDMAPIVERAWAEAAGVGFVGKNTLVIAPARTSWMVLAVMFVTLEAEPDRPITRDHCGRCARCLDACPTGAFVGPRVLDARRCISYYTIESTDLAPAELLPGFGRWVFGCDACQEACPHNAAAPDPEEDDLRPRNAWLDLDETLASSDEALDARYLGTPLARPGAVGLKRNALVALGNLHDRGAAPSIERGLAHLSPVVQAAARWAAAQPT